MEVSVKDKMTGSESGHRWKVKSEQQTNRSKGKKNSLRQKGKPLRKLELQVSKKENLPGREVRLVSAKKKTVGPLLGE